MKHHLYLLDLDRTMFDTDRFCHDLITVLVDQYSIDHEAYVSELPRYLEADTGSYDFYAQAMAATGASKDELDAIITKNLSGHPYIYDDVAPWLAHHDQDQTEIIVITVGHDWFQSLKLHHSPELKTLQQIITPTNKGEVVRQGLVATETGYQLPFATGHYRNITLVDDNPSTFVALGQLKPVMAYHLARPTERFALTPSPTGTHRITSLKEVS
jgi:hypothetical protein